MGWALLGKLIVNSVASGIQMVEGSGTTKKGTDKAGLAMQFAREMLGSCPSAQGIDPALYRHPKVSAALEKYTEAYVDLQNAIAAAQAEHAGGA